MSNSKDSPPRSQGYRRDWFWALSLFVTALGARLWLIHRAGTPLPFWDQWEELRIVYVPFFEGHLSLAALFAAHNEHRMFFNRFYDLAILLLSGQWDNQVEMLANAITYTAGITGFGWVVARRFGSSYWPVIALPLMVCLILPFGWENTVGGFHSQVYFGIIFALSTIWLLGCHEPKSPKWWCGVLAGIASLCVPVSGILSSAAICGLVGLKSLREPAVSKKYWTTAAICLLLIVAGWELRVEVLHHRALMAHSAEQFLISLGQYLAWPWIVVPPYAVFNIVPLLLLAWFYLREGKVAMPAEELVLGVGLWAGLQAAATAYARGGQMYPQWRYMDCTCFLLIANCYSIVLLVTRHLRGSGRKTWWNMGFFLWGLANISGLLLLDLQAWRIDIPERQFFFHAQIQNARAYFATGDVRILDGKPKPELPLYEGDPYAPQPAHVGGKLAQYVDNPWVWKILPSCVRRPLDMIPGAATGFVTNGAAPVKPKIAGELFWSSYGPDGTITKGRFESAPIITNQFPFLEFRVAGDLGKPGLSLALLEVASGKITPVIPAEPPGSRWQTCRVKAPAGEFKILASNESADGWLAFQAPRGVTWLPWASAKVESAGGWIFCIGLAFYVGGVIAALRGSARSSIILKEPNSRPPRKSKWCPQ